MTTKPEVLAVKGGRDTGLPVDRAAEVIARLVGGEVGPLRLAAGLSPDHAAGLVVRALREPGPVTAVLPADEANGLEFDSVVVVEPALIAGEDRAGLGEAPPAATRRGLRALYVATTRPTRRLVVVHSLPLPPALATRPGQAG